jgi:hypothetical protein
MDIWHIIAAVAIVVLSFNLGLVLSFLFVTRKAPPIVKDCWATCTPDECACWDKEQRYRRADLDRQAMGGENVRDVRISGSPGSDLH